MARNEHDGRSLEERLASLDAMSGDKTGPSPAPEGAQPPQGGEEQESAPPATEPPAAEEPAAEPPAAGPQAEQTDPNANPWLAAPPPYQGAPENFGPPQPPPYEGGPMPQPFDGGMLPPPYAAGGYQPSPYDANGNAAPPLDQLPPYPADQFGRADAPGQGYQPIDPATGRPYPQDTDDSGRPYVPFDPATGRPIPPDQQYPPVDPATGQPLQPGPNAGGQPFPPVDPATGQPLQPGPNAPGQPFPPVDPATGQPYAQDPNAGGQPYPPVDPATGQPFQPGPHAEGQPFPPVDPATGQPYAQDPNAGGQPYPPVDPATGQPFQPGPNPEGQAFPPVDPATGQPLQPGPNAGGQPFPPVDPSTGQPYAPDPNAAGQPFPPVDPATGQPFQPGPNAPGQPYPPVDPATGQPYAQDPNAGGQPYPPVDPNTGQPYAPPVDPGTGQPYPPQGYGYPAGPPQGQGQYPQALGQMMQQGQPQQQEPQSGDSLSSENLLGERRIAPSSGWRRAVYKATAGSIHPGESQGDLRRKDLIARARTAVAGGHHRVAVMSLKGGVGKTTTTTGLGSMLGSLRGDRVIAVDANPDRGTLSDKVRLETAATVRDLLNNREQIHRYADVRAFTSQNEARLEILASDRDPAVSEAFSAEDYAAVAVVLEQYYSVCITDCGTGLLHSAMAGVLSLADQLVLVSSPSVDGARSASATLDWLEAHDHGHLVRNGVVVLSMVRNRTRSQVDLDKLQAHFESRCRAVVRIPYDDHLEEGAEVELEQLAPATREAYLTLAAVVGDGFAFQRPQT
ncbi:MinD/ParA family protein [Actinomadura sp. K4S16]|uniref:MinD/ParA family ATP-binding protein n=1 Tax=Actinomadura sp. K4S16 TaxID=1316147 RepID=UPI002286656B|nr:AAA family ATPase [Actinomadura sp. K4S16]